MTVFQLLEQCHPRLCSKIIDNNGEVRYTSFNQLIPRHFVMMTEGLKFRERVPYVSSNRQMTVRVVPISLFSDDTSGNRSKKWNCFDSWVMDIAAFDLEDSNKYENHFFLCTSNHKVTAMEMVKPLTEDLLELEKGIVMYDAELQKNVFVIAPVLLFRGDNVRQAELALRKGSRVITHVDSVIEPGSSNKWGEIGFKLTGAEDLLKLKAVDLSQDLPLQLLSLFFRNYNFKALHCNLTSSLTAFRSFVGRDFKILVQLLPTLLQKANFFNPSLFDENQDSFRSMFECFDNLGLLASLVYMEKIDNFHYYKQILDITVSKTITAMDDLHHTTVLTRRRSAAAGTEAITKMNFSSLGEQQHKFMRELLCHTNRQNGGRDVAVRFAEEFMLRHISQGGLFVKDPSFSVWETCGVKVLESFDATINQSELELLDNINSQKKLAL
ncbi:uncharacterized protein EV154DRAFT_606206 [Mucor mucedo]|uniref:uncharacterized protein n=1 Tax=Mucor mucedo TaxID=29922 RepID=UPI00221FD03D|nr:uncharacterized protein EV154DRAFT_606206 [Mucor mucedo]KAI7880889.1 hypothetical protein EV154DRAFT_606206 [Mucor mucedo]